MSVKSLKSLILPQVKTLSVSRFLNSAVRYERSERVICCLCLQVSFYAYTTAFNIVNGNASYVSMMRPRGHAGVCLSDPSWVKPWCVLNTCFRFFLDSSPT